jgi:arylsulfatase A-like enzyme
VGWSEWAGAGNGYPEYDYDLNQNGTIHHYGNAHDDYLTFVVSGLGQKFIRNTAQGTAPFLIEIATFAPHAPYIPGPDDLNLYPGLFVPRSPAYGARAKASAPEWERDIPALTQAEMDTMDHDYRLRAQAVMAVDEMIANLQATLVAMGADKNTYIFFSSDNGYHMGEHSLRPGKMTAFDTDIRVPLIVTGPGVPAGKWVDEIVENIDLCPTFDELGGAETAASVDGHSLVRLLQGQPTLDWRTVALIEHHGPVELAEDPDLPEEHSGNPTKYESIRIPGAVYVEYATGETEYYDVDSDPWELTNTASTLSPGQLTTLHDTLNAVVNCHDGQSCWAAQHLPK